MPVRKVISSTNDTGICVPCNASGITVKPACKVRFVFSIPYNLILLLLEYVHTTPLIASENFQEKNTVFFIITDHHTIKKKPYERVSLYVKLFIRFLLNTNFMQNTQK